MNNQIVSRKLGLNFKVSQKIFKEDTAELTLIRNNTFRIKILKL